MSKEDDLKLIVAALSAVLFYENEGDILTVSKQERREVIGSKINVILDMVKMDYYT